MFGFGVVVCVVDCIVFGGVVLLFVVIVCMFVGGVGGECLLFVGGGFYFGLYGGCWVLLVGWRIDVCWWG